MTPALQAAVAEAVAQTRKTTECRDHETRAQHALDAGTGSYSWWEKARQERAAQEIRLAEAEAAVFDAIADAARDEE